MAETQKLNKMAPSIIGKDVKITGQFISSGDVQIEGKLQGDVASHAITIGASAEVEGELIAEIVTVYGRVTGTIRALQVHLCAKCVVAGDIHHTALAVESGAQFDGRAVHEKDPLGQAAPQTLSSDDASVQPH